MLPSQKITLALQLHWKLQEAADLVTFTEEILNGKLHFLCSASKELENYIPNGIEGIFIELN